MRKILFRCKLQESGEWIYWDMLGRITTQFGKISKYTRKTRYGEHHYYFVHQLWDRLDRSTIGQFTGQRDKNKKPIFEGDVFRYGFDEVAAVAVVKFGEFGFGSQFDMNQVGFYVEWNPRAMYYRTDLGFWVKQREIEIIGNAHDNPELLGGADV